MTCWPGLCTSCHGVGSGLRWSPPWRRPARLQEETAMSPESPTYGRSPSLDRASWVMDRPQKLMARVRSALQVKHYSPRTVKAYTSWIRRYIHFHNLRHPLEMDATHSRPRTFGLGVAPEPMRTGVAAERTRGFRTRSYHGACSKGKVSLCPGPHGGAKLLPWPGQIHPCPSRITHESAADRSPDLRWTTRTANANHGQLRTTDRPLAAHVMHLQQLTPSRAGARGLL